MFIRLEANKKGVVRTIVGRKKLSITTTVMNSFQYVVLYIKVTYFISKPIKTMVINQ